MRELRLYCIEYVEMLVVNRYNKYPIVDGSYEVMSPYNKYSLVASECSIGLASYNILKKNRAYNPVVLIK